MLLVLQRSATTSAGWSRTYSVWDHLRAYDTSARSRLRRADFEIVYRVHLVAREATIFFEIALICNVDHKVRRDASRPNHQSDSGEIGMEWRPWHQEAKDVSDQAKRLIGHVRLRSQTFEVTLGPPVSDIGALH